MQKIVIFSMMWAYALKDYLDREINASFSGGELKRIEIATLFP